MDRAPIRVTVEHKAHPNLRKLARAPISLAQRELDKQLEQPLPRRKNGA